MNNESFNVELSSVITWTWERFDILGSGIVNLAGTNEMCSVSVSYSKVLRLRVVDWHDIGTVVHSTRQGLFVIDLRVKNIFDTKSTCLGAC